MHRFYLPPPQCGSDRLTLSERESHHAAVVLRLRAGDAATVLDGEGGELRCEITEPDRRATRLRVRERRRLASLPCAVTLLAAVPKGKTMEVIVEQSVELGARRIVPLLTERTVVQLDAAGAEAKREKWRLTAIEALKQCGAPWLPRVERPVSPAALLQSPPADFPAELSLVGALAERRPARDCFAGFRARHGRAPASVALWVGPEGDFTAAEMQGIIASGVQPVSFGPLVLRCDTAVSFGLSVIAHEVMAG